MVLESLVDELENTAISGHEGRCSPHLADCLYNVADTCNDLVSDVFAKIMLKTRDASARVRLRIP